MTGNTAAFLPIVQREVRELNPRIPLSNPRTMDDVVRLAAAETSFTMAVLGSASLVALLLGLVGIYGVVSYVVTQRSRELGVRLALGATRASVHGMVVCQGTGLAVVGVAVGLTVALAASRIVESLLFGVSARDPTVAQQPRTASLARRPTVAQQRYAARRATPPARIGRRPPLPCGEYGY